MHRHISAVLCFAAGIVVAGIALDLVDMYFESQEGKFDSKEEELDSKKEEYELTPDFDANIPELPPLSRQHPLSFFNTINAEELNIPNLAVILDLRGDSDQFPLPDTFKFWQQLLSLHTRMFKKYPAGHPLFQTVGLNVVDDIRVLRRMIRRTINLSDYYQEIVGSGTDGKAREHRRIIMDLTYQVGRFCAAQTLYELLLERMRSKMRRNCLRPAAVDSEEDEVEDGDAEDDEWSVVGFL